MGNNHPTSTGMSNENMWIPFRGKEKWFLVFINRGKHITSWKLAWDKPSFCQTWNTLTKKKFTTGRNRLDLNEEIYNTNRFKVRVFDMVPKIWHCTLTLNRCKIRVFRSNIVKRQLCYMLYVHCRIYFRNWVPTDNSKPHTLCLLDNSKSMNICY